MKPRKTTEPNLRNKLSQSFLEALEADFREYGKGVIEQMREKDPTRYAELAGKLIMTAEPPADGIDFKSAKNMQDIGFRLLRSVGVPEFDISEQMIQDAIEANNAFVDRLQAIRDCAQASEDEIH